MDTAPTKEHDSSYRFHVPRLIFALIVALVIGGIVGFASLWVFVVQPMITFLQSPVPGGLPPVPPTPPQETSGGVRIEEQLKSQSEIKKFADLEELRKFLEQNVTGQSYYYGGITGMMGGVVGRGALKTLGAPVVMMEESADSSVSQGMRMGGSARDYSTTNIQVAGVDEADIVKTDGKYVYAVSKQSVFIIDAFPGEQAQILAKIEFKSRPQGLYLGDNRLVVYGADDAIQTLDAYQKFARRSSYTFLKVFDISDKRNPIQMRDLDFEGYYTNSRMVGDHVYFLTTTATDYWDDTTIVPRILENSEELPTDASSPRCNCPNVYYIPALYQQYQYTSVVAVNVQEKDEPVNHDVYLIPGSQNIYMSQENLYIVYTKYVSEYQLALEVMRDIVFSRLPQKDQERIKEIEATENYILSPEEKMNKIGAILERYNSRLTEDDRSALESEVEQALKAKYKSIAKELEKTVIHKIGIEKDKLEYRGVGEVTGAVLNQFSMDEHDGNFRIATTKNQQWGIMFEEDSLNENTSYSNVYILDKDLHLIGALEELAPNEQIKSVRFMQGRAYLVTFERTDPLFVIDVSNPTNPRVLGELKIPGFSEYLHPYDDTTLIGLGRDAEENEWGGVRTKGIKLSLFDVADVAKPREIDTYIIGDSGSNSVALYDHHAFLFSKEKNLLVIPVEMWGSQPIILREETEVMPDGKILPPQSQFRGALVFTVKKDGFSLKGKIDHAEGIFSDENEYWNGYSYYDTTVQRSLYIDELLYTVSQKYVKVNDLDDLSLVKKLELKKEKQQDFEVVN